MDGLLQPWIGSAYRHIPYASPYSVLDFRFAGSAANNRWNAAGEHTLYLAGDVGVAVAEYARHLALTLTPAVGSATHERSLHRLEVRIERVLDLRDESVLTALSRLDAPACFLDQTISRATGNYIRATTQAQGLLVPSMAFLDDPSRFVLVLFLEKLHADSARFIVATAAEGLLHLHPSV